MSLLKVGISDIYSVEYFKKSGSANEAWLSFRISDICRTVEK